MKFFKLGVLVLIVLVYAWLGTWALFVPKSFSAAVDLQVLSPLGFAEIRSVYGGLNTMVAVLAAFVLIKKEFQKVFFGGFSLYLVGILIGRLVSVFTGEFQGLAILGFTVFEIAFFCVSIFFRK